MLTFVTSPAEYSTRITIDFTILLTTVAFKFATSQYIPKVPYNTVVDLYVLGTFIFLVVVAVENGVAYALKAENDIWIAVALGACWILFNLVMVALSTSKMISRMRLRKIILSAKVHQL